MIDPFNAANIDVMLSDSPGGVLQRRFDTRTSSISFESHGETYGEPCEIRSGEFFENSVHCNYWIANFLFLCSLDNWNFDEKVKDAHINIGKKIGHSEKIL